MENLSGLKHIMFLRPISLKQIKDIIKCGKFYPPIIIENNKIKYETQEIYFRFDDDQNNIIGLETNTDCHDAINYFYLITEYIGKAQIKIHSLPS